MKILVEINVQKNEGPRKESFDVGLAVVEHLRVLLAQYDDSAYVYPTANENQAGTEYEIVTLNVIRHSVDFKVREDDPRTLAAIANRQARRKKPQNDRSKAQVTD